MRLFYNVPKDQQFYSRYASLVPTLSKLSYLAQIVSALTEAGILYAIVYGSIVPFWPEIAPKAALAGSVVGTLFLELGLRKFVPFGARAIIKKRFKGWDGWITGFVLAVGVGLIIASGLLSFKGSSLLIEAVAPEPETLTTIATDSTATAATATAAAQLAADQQAARAQYSDLIEAAEQTAGADIRQLDNEYQSLLDKEQRTGQSYATRKAAIRGQIETVRANSSRTTAELKTARANALAAIQAAYRSKLETISTDQRKGRLGIEQANETARAEIDNRIANYGGGLAYFTLFCLIVFVVCVTIQELHRAGAGIDEQIEAGAYDFEAGPIAAFITAVQGRFDRFVYGIITRIEYGTKEAPEPVAAPLIWSRSEGTIKATKTDGVQRKISPSKAAKVAAATVAPERRQIGFGDQQTAQQTQPDATTGANALTQCVKDATATQSTNVKIAVCDHCGNDYEQRTTWQRFCQTQCRKDHHAEQHGGNEFDPTRKPWNHA